MNKYAYRTPIDSFDLMIEMDNGVIHRVSFIQKEDGQKVNDLPFDWFDRYFRDGQLDAMPPLNASSLTPFQKKVFSLLMEIPFGTTVSYEEIKNRYEARYDSRMSSQAIGQALKRNPFPILVPCHRIKKRTGN